MNLDVLKARMEEIEADTMTEWNSMFAEKVDDEADKKEDTPDDLEETSDDKEEKDDKNEEKPEEDLEPAPDDSDTPSDDDSIVNDLNSDSGEEPPEVDEDGTNSEDALNELAEKIHLSKNEVAILDSMIESETDAISDYSKALNETKNKYVRKLLTEILTDESKHLAQLKYLKSMGTEGDYVPKDKEAIDELHDTLESIIENLL